MIDQKQRFLFIDDSDFNNTYIKMMLDIETESIDAHFVLSAIQALEYLENISEDNFPHVIIIDINMPLMDGFEFAERYKTKYYSSHPQTKLFITSSTRRLSEIERAKSIDIVEDFIEKPISFKDIEQRVLPLIALCK